MYAAYIDRLGGPELIRYGPLPDPEPEPGEILVEVDFATVNHVDTFVRSGAWRTPLTFPFVVGRDLVGTVVRAAPDVSDRFAPGERVWSLSMGYDGRQGAAAERVAVPADRLYRVPEGADPAELVALAHPAATAHLALSTHGRLRAGESVVVVGAGGNVGGALVAMASHAGARVTAVASPTDADHCRASGAHAVLDRRDPDLYERIARLHPDGVDLHVDAAGRNEVEPALAGLARRGRLVLLAGMRSRPVLPVGSLYLLDRSVLGFAISQATVDELAEAAARVGRLAADGVLRPRRCDLVSLEHTGRAHRAVEGGLARGRRIVIAVGRGPDHGTNLTNSAPMLGATSPGLANLPTMSASIIDTTPLFELRASLPVSASPEQVYEVVSDLPRSSEWSPECRGGEWISGEPRRVGSVFRGENLRADDVVGWAPLIRGVWHTEARVTAADPGRTFRWMMLSHAGADQESVWGFDIEPTDDGGSVLVHHFRMNRATAGIHTITANLDEEERKRFITEWTAKLEQDLDVTLARIKRVIEES
ncbi:zinc-binding dehydrogenase [Nocardiopsis lambiniae]|uniref:Zinc-binding dehydrogenase n=1 Tax=Nocardiopsis lambiniae TaxID=3075539 RepID=A0ABU2MA07_9ACTN|nr:zinc-binding dehydrogenase [Nocardiopsis sp. DSM 44743]MDT0329508.1 zinc-binding dehydrogenase [Nocardiopsis sp. DSM 44743]